MNPDDEKRGTPAPANGATGPAGVRPTRVEKPGAADEGNDWGSAVSGPLEAYGASEDDVQAGGAAASTDEDATGETSDDDALGEEGLTDEDGSAVHEDVAAAGIGVAGEEPAAEAAASWSSADEEPAVEQEAAEAQADEEEPGAAEDRAPVPPMLPPRRDPSMTPAEVTEAEQRQARKTHGAPEFIPLERVVGDATFQLREAGDLHKLATDLARLGQLFPIDVRPQGDGFQVVTGFRRVAALRFLKRNRVLARVHTDLSDEDALLMALAAAIHAEPVDTDTLVETRDRLEREGRMTPAVRDMLEKALATDDGLAPENVEEEIDADELADDVTMRMGEINQDLALLAEVFAQLDADKKAELLKQLAYAADLVAYLEGR